MKKNILIAILALSTTVSTVLAVKKNADVDRLTEMADKAMKMAEAAQMDAMLQREIAEKNERLALEQQTVAAEHARRLEEKLKKK